MYMQRFIALLLFLSLVAAVDATGESGEMIDWVLKGDAYLSQGRPLLALAEYEKAQQAGAGSAPFLNRMAAIYMETGKFSEALMVLRASLSEEPGQLALYSRIGEAHLAMGNLDSAVTSVDYARRLVPDNSAVHSALAFLLLQTGDIARAKAHLDTATKLDDRNPEAHRLLGFYFSQRDSFEVAVSHYEKLATLAPQDIEAYNNIAFLYAQRQQYDQALAYYKKAAKRSVDPYITQAINENLEAVRAIIAGKMRARYILVRTETAARDIRERLDSGGDFVQLAKQFSVAPNAQDGGDLGFFGPGELLPQFEEAVIQLTVGNLSDVITISMGYVIIQRLN
jgi:Flp pilus assembly protein TadD